MLLTLLKILCAFVHDHQQIPIVKQKHKSEMTIEKQARPNYVDLR